MKAFSPACNYLCKIAVSGSNRDRLDWFVGRDYGLVQELINTGYLSHFGDWTDPPSLITAEGLAYIVDLGNRPLEDLDILPIHQWQERFSRELRRFNKNLTEYLPEEVFEIAGCVERQVGDHFSVTQRGRELANYLILDEPPERSEPPVLVQETVSQAITATPVEAPEPVRVQIKSTTLAVAAETKGLISVISTDKSSMRCPYCFDSDSDLETIKCNYCNAPQHKECYAEYGKCITCKRSITALAVIAPKEQTYLSNGPPTEVLTYAIITFLVIVISLIAMAL